MTLLLRGDHGDREHPWSEAHGLFHAPRNVDVGERIDRHSLVLGDDGSITNSTTYATDGSGASGGSDTIYGEAGSDVMAGGNFVDFLYGDNIGGIGEDLMAGDQLSRNGVSIQSAPGAGGNDS